MEILPKSKETPDKMWEVGKLARRFAHFDYNSMHPTYFRIFGTYARGFLDYKRNPDYYGGLEGVLKLDDITMEHLYHIEGAIKDEGVRKSISMQEGYSPTLQEFLFFTRQYLKELKEIVKSEHLTEIKGILNNYLTKLKKKPATDSNEK